MARRLQALCRTSAEHAALKCLAAAFIGLVSSASAAADEANWYSEKFCVVTNRSAVELGVSSPEVGEWRNAPKVVKLKITKCVDEPNYPYCDVVPGDWQFARIMLTDGDDWVWFRPSFSFEFVGFANEGYLDTSVDNLTYVDKQSLADGREYLFFLEANCFSEDQN